MESARGRTRSRRASEPKRSTMPAHMLWIDRNEATEGQAMDSPSKTSVPASRESSAPPCASAT